jgi:hypothetical protein
MSRDRAMFVPEVEPLHRPTPALDRDDELAAGAAVSEVADRSRNFLERERPVDDGPDGAALEQRSELLQILLSFL